MIAYTSEDYTLDECRRQRDELRSSGNYSAVLIRTKPRENGVKFGRCYVERKTVSRKCPKCGLTKLCSDFYTDCYNCKACTIKYQGEHIKVWKRKPENKIILQARWAVSNGIARGKITRPDTCSRCGMTCKPHAHHSDYSKPLDVTWLCKSCHLKEHGKTLPAPVI